MSANTHDRLAAVRQKFIASLKERADTIETMLDAPEADNEHAQLQTLVHKIAGSAGFYGEQQIADAAQRIDIQLQQSPSPGEITALTDELRALIAKLRAL